MYTCDDEDIHVTAGYLGFHFKDNLVLKLLLLLLLLLQVQMLLFTLSQKELPLLAYRTTTIWLPPER